VIAICITTRNRDKMFQYSLDQHLKYAPNDAHIYVVSDDNGEGVSVSKNRCLKLAVEAGAEHIFLFDDDCYPIDEFWWKPYVESKEPHLMYQFKLPNKSEKDMQILYKDDKIVSYSHTRGAMIYLDRRVLNVVGGFDTRFKQYGFEHTDYTNRIHNAGLTTHRAMDIPNSNKLLYCLDQDGIVESSIPEEERKKNWTANYTLYRKNRNSKEYMEFR
jgi:GT2 family glycosyltransferase